MTIMQTFEPVFASFFYLPTFFVHSVKGLIFFFSCFLPVHHLVITNFIEQKNFNFLLKLTKTWNENIST